MVGEGKSGLIGVVAASVTVPVKRKRGRPRKNPGPVGSAGLDAASVLSIAPGSVGMGPDDDENRPMGGEKPGLAVLVPLGFKRVAGPTGLYMKRKRGRPRKNPAPEIGVSAGPVRLQALKPCDGAGVVGQVAAPTKRGPGRPRKLPLAAVMVPVAPMDGPAARLAGAGIAIGPVAGPVRRRRGRPRRTPWPGLRFRVHRLQSL